MINTQVSLEELNKMNSRTMMEHLKIEYTEIRSDCLAGKMPVNHTTHQPLGLLHGGASVVLAETLGSVAANLCVKPSEAYCVGMEINANHLKSVKKGWVFGKATPVHLGKKTQIWDIRISSDTGELVCISRLTMAVIKRKRNLAPNNKILPA
ncbi:MAG: hotdog fold thioesterase [Cytophagales bacterium]|nr:hotdog fold thioesterase [Cytophagales bacterium]